MLSSARRYAAWLGMCVCAVALSLANPARAQVTQTDAAKTPLPQPVPAAEADLVNNSWAWNANTMVNRDTTGANLNPAVRYGDFYAPPTYPQFVTGDAINLSGCSSGVGKRSTLRKMRRPVQATSPPSAASPVSSC